MTQPHEIAPIAPRDWRQKGEVDEWGVDEVKLVGGRVLIECDERGERVSINSPIIRPQMSATDGEEKRYCTGKIAALGPGMKVGISPKWKPGPPYRWPMPDIEIGSRVVYRTWAVRTAFSRGSKKFDVVSDEVIDVVIEYFENQTGGITMANFRPLSDRILVKRLDPLKKTKGGIIIPDNAAEKPVEGDVLAVGPGRVQVDGTVRPLDMIVGDRVLFGKFSGTEIKIDGVECLILREEDVLGIVVKKPAEPEGAAAE
jgi:chaperonin GroES